MKQTAFYGGMLILGGVLASMYYTARIDSLHQERLTHQQNYTEYKTQWRDILESDQIDVNRFAQDHEKIRLQDDLMIKTIEAHTLEEQLELLKTRMRNSVEDRSRILKPRILDWKRTLPL